MPPPSRAKIEISDAPNASAVSASTIALDRVPLSAAYRAFAGDDPLRAATAGDDYQLLCALPPDQRPTAVATCVGSFADGRGLALTDQGEPVAVPERLGFEHRA